MARSPKIRGKRKLLLPRKRRDRLTVSPRDTVQLPLVDGIPLLGGCPFAPYCGCDGCSAAELLNEFRMALHVWVIGKTFRQVKRHLSEDYSRDFRKSFPHHLDMPSSPPKPEAIEAGKRLRRTREALGFTTVRRFSQIVDEDESKLTKYENGIAMPPARFVSKLRQKYGVDHNWIYDNDMSRLPHDLVEKLIAESKERQAEDEAAPEPALVPRPSLGRSRPKQ